MSARRSRRALGPLLGPPQRLEVELTGVGPDGAATGALDGETVSAAFGLPGERVVLAVLERREGHIEGRVLHVLRASPDRVEPPCPYFGTCGGCQWQHVTYERQLAYKRDNVAARPSTGIATTRASRSGVNSANSATPRTISIASFVSTRAPS